ncbi:hypothetical protein JCM10450v2_007117 [Rhodotorula kratochvilovae]
MAAFFGHSAPVSSAPPSASDGPIKLEGFPLPSLPTHNPALAAFHLYPGQHFHPQQQHHPQHLPQQQLQPGQGGSGIDPAVLLGFTAAASSSSGQHQQHGVGSYGSLAGTSFGAPGGSVLSDADLDFESVLASLGAAAQPQQQQQHVGSAGQYGQQGGAQAQNDLFGQGGMFDQSAMQQPPPQQQQHQQLSPRLSHGARVPSYYTQHTNPPPLVHSQSHSLPLQHQPQQRDAFPAPAAPAPAPAPTAPAAERGSSSKRSVSTERTGRTGRTATTGSGSVGKAPRQSRSRSARRSSSAAGYDRDRPSPSSRDSGGRRGEAAAAAAAEAEPSPGATPSGSGAVGIPHSAGADAAHQYAMSLPAYPSASLAGTPSSLPAHSAAGAGGWGALAAVQHAHAYSAHAFAPPPVALPGAHGAGASAMDAASGWRASPTGGSAAASAPPATGLAGRSPTAGGGVKAPHGGKKGKGLADVQEEDDGKGDPISEKRRKRRESHNAVERRRRDNINDRIAELSLLVPEEFLTAASPPSANAALPGLDDGPASPAIGALSLRSPGPGTSAVLSGSPASAPGAGFAKGAAAAGEKLSAQQLAAREKPNKGVVLAKSVEYIKYLQGLVELQEQHATELQRQNAVLRDALASAPGGAGQQSAQASGSSSGGSGLPFLPPQPPSFPGSTTTSSFSPSHGSSPASPEHAHAHAHVGAGGGSALGLALDSPSGGGGANAFFDFGASPALSERRGSEDSAAAGGEGEELRAGRSARAGERAWTPMLEGIEGMKALKEEDMDES